MKCYWGGVVLLRKDRLRRRSVSQGNYARKNNAIVQTCPQSLVTICSPCVQRGVEWKVLPLLFELVTLPRTLCVLWRVTERRASGPSQVKGRKWGTFPEGCRALWVNSGHVEGTAQRGLKLG